MKKTKHPAQRLPAGYSAERIEAIRKHYDGQTEEAAALEIQQMIEAGPGAESVVVPKELVPVVREMVSVFKASRGKRKRSA